MKDKYTIMDKVMIALFVLYSFYYLEPFFIWKTFSGGIFRNLLGVIPYRTIFGLGVIALWVLLYSKKNISKPKLKICAMVLAVAVSTVVLAGGSKKTGMFSLAWLPYFVVISYILCPERIQKKSYDIYITVFAITLILPIIYYVMNHIGIRIPYIRLESAEEIKVIRGKYYKLYPLATQLTSIWDPSWQELRMSGVFDESGRVGTVAGLFLTSERFKIKDNWKNIIIMIAGILSFSLAFYAITIIYYLVSSFNKKKYKNIAAFIGMIILYLVFMNINFSNPTIAQFQSRLEITSKGLSGNNRTNADFDALISDLYRSSDIYTILFGKGDGAIGEIQALRNIDGPSYKCMIYNFGYVGFGLSIAWLILYALQMYRVRGADKPQIIAVMTVYLANMYQRPSVFYMGYMLIFFGGMAIATQKKILPRDDLEKNNKRKKNNAKISGSSSYV